MGKPEDRFAIRTARTLLRPASMDDVDALHGLWRDPEVRQFLWDDEEISRERTEAAVWEVVENFGRHGFGLWISEVQEAGGALVGFCGLRHLDGEPGVEVLYGVSPPEWGRGLATELALAMLRYGFERIGLERVVGIADAGNAASRRVLKKVGMTFEGYVLDGGRREARYEIRREDFGGTPPTART